jgi:hypothetical protein
MEPNNRDLHVAIYVDEEMVMSERLGTVDVTSVTWPVLAEQVRMLASVGDMFYLMAAKSEDCEQLLAMLISTFRFVHKAATETIGIDDSYRSISTSPELGAEDDQGLP